MSYFELEGSWFCSDGDGAVKRIEADDDAKEALVAMERRLRESNRILASYRIKLESEGNRKQADAVARRIELNRAAIRPCSAPDCERPACEGDIYCRNCKG